MAFGKIIDQHPLSISQQEYRDLLSEYGVIAFKGFALSYAAQNLIMSNYGPLQDWKEQQAPENYADKNGGTLINLSNDDFLGKTRMGWHTDQTYLKTPYLPIRSLYCPDVPSPGNITSFLDIFTITDLLLEGYPELIDMTATYSSGEHKTDRSLFSHCDHFNRTVFRFDTRMSSDKIDIDKFSSIIKTGIDKAEQFHIEWEQHAFVIFDNNRCPHRRSKMAGDCHLHRLTSTFWLT